MEISRYIFSVATLSAWLEDSDVDIIVVSDALKGLDIGKRYASVRKLLPLNKGFDILTYTREEFELAKRRSVVLQYAAEYRIKIA